MPAPFRALVCAAVLPFAASCGEGREGGADAGAAGARWTVSGAPVLEIGMVEGPAEHQFDGIAGVGRWDDGEVIVADRGSGELRVFDAGGRHLRSMGRRGKGPGEFEGISGLFLVGDSVGVWEAQPKRFTVFSRAGELVGAETLDLPGFNARLEAVFPDGSMVARPGVDVAAIAESKEGQQRRSFSYLLRAPGGAWTPFGDFAGQEQVHSRGSGSFSFGGILFGRDHVFGAGQRRWYTGDSDAFAVTVRELDGSELRVLRREHVPLAVTDELLAVAREERRASNARLRRRMEQMGSRARPGPEESLLHRPTLPAFDAIVEDADELVWVRHFHFPSDDPQRWSVFSPDGELVAEAVTPARLRVMQIGRDWVLGVAKDDDDVESVQLFSLVRS